MEMQILVGGRSTQVIEFSPKRKKITRMQLTKANLYLFKTYLTLPDLNSLNWPKLAQTFYFHLALNSMTRILTSPTFRQKSTNVTAKKKRSKRVKQLLNWQRRVEVATLIPNKQTKNIKESWFRWESILSYKKVILNLLTFNHLNPEQPKTLLKTCKVENHLKVSKKVLKHKLRIIESEMTYV